MGKIFNLKIMIMKYITLFLLSLPCFLALNEDFGVLNIVGAFYFIGLYFVLKYTKVGRKFVSRFKIVE